MKTKIFLLAALFVFSTFSVTDAAVPTPSIANDELVLLTQDLIEEAEPTLYKWGDREGSFQALDLEMKIVRPQWNYHKSQIRI